MKNQNPTTTIKRLVQSVAVLDGLMLLTGGILIFRFYAYITDGGTSLVLSIVFSLFAITYCALGMLILSRHSRHTIGWLFLMVSFSAALQILLNGLGGLALGLPIQSKWVRASLQLVGDFIWPLWLFTPFTLGLLYFPDGHLPSRRWWPFAALAILNIAAFSVFQLIIPWAPETIHRIGMDNPFVIAGSEEYFPFFAGIPNVINALGA